MPRLPATGICVLSIDVAQGDGRAAELCRRLAAADVPATWSFPAPPCDDVVDAIRQYPKNEVALLADRWAVERSDRRTFSQSLARGLTDLHSAGFHATTIALPGGRLAAHDDLLVKHEVSVVRVSDRREKPKPGGWWTRVRSTSEPTGFVCLRWGLWEAAVSVDLGGAGIRGVAKKLDRLAGRGSSAIIVAPSEFLTSATTATSKLIDYLVRRREEHLLRLSTLAGIAHNLRAERSASAARSILRPAA